MEKFFFTPGPTALYKTTSAYFRQGFKEDIPSISHRSKEFQKIFQDLTNGLRQLLGIPKDYQIFIVGSGTEAMERAIQNCVKKYSFHFVNGSFSERFFQTAQELGKKPASIEVPLGEGFNFTHTVIPKKTEMICFTHNESSTGVMTPVAEIAKIAKAHPDMLVAVDIVSTVPYVDLDYRLLDVIFFSVQKGFGLPAGMGIMIVSPRAIAKAETLMQQGVSIGSFHGFPTLARSVEKWQTPETPPVLEMYALGKVIHDMLAVGITTIRKETEKKAQLLYEFLDAHQSLCAFVKEKQFRSQTIIVVNTQQAKGDIRKALTAKGLVIGSGYGKNKDIQVRIANFPAHSVADIKRLIKTIKTL